MATRVGVDVGGTNTDAVVVRGQAEVLGWAKVLTTADVTTGVTESINGALVSARVGEQRNYLLLMQYPCNNPGSSSLVLAAPWLTLPGSFKASSSILLLKAVARCRP